MLNIKIERDTLLRPLSKVTGIIERRHTMPILSNVLMEKKDQALVLLANDMEIQIADTVTNPAFAELPDGFKITTSGKKFLDILKAMPEQPAVELKFEQQVLEVRSGRSRFQLQTLPAEDYPKIAELQTQTSRFTLPQKLLKSLLARVQYAMAHQDVRYYLNGIYLETWEQGLKLVSTDGHRLAFIEQAITTPLQKAEVILPRKTMQELNKILQDSDEPIDVELSATQARFSLGSTQMISKVVDGKFPDYTRVLPKHNDKIITLNRLQFLQALQRAAILSNEKFRGVQFTLENNGLKITCSNSEQEQAEEWLGVDYQGPKIDMGFNIAYMLDVLTNSNEAEVQLHFLDGLSSVLVTLVGIDQFKYVVMPMRI